jgi:hypothetical protein
MKAARPIGGWRGRAIPYPFDKRILSCSGSVQDEILASIDMYAEIKDGGKELLKANGHQNLSKAYLRFQAYIRQAKTFYEAAELLHHRAGALNYYYSFLNFSKALIYLKNPTFIDHNLHHGIKPKPTSGSLRKQHIQITQDGVLPRFYKLVTDQQISAGAKIKVADLLGYCSDVEYEYAKLKYGEPVSFFCKLVIGVHRDQKSAFPIIAVLNGQHPAFEKLRNYIEKGFDEVEIAKNTARDMFGMLAEEGASTRFFESRRDWVIPATSDMLTNDVASLLSNLISYNPFNDDRLFVINRPIKTPKIVPMQELIAIYCSMFFLGSLVRYRPELLEAMLSTKDAWLIERFTKSAPLTFLRLVRNLFDKEYLAFASR